MQTDTLFTDWKVPEVGTNCYMQNIGSFIFGILINQIIFGN